MLKCKSAVLFRQMGLILGELDVKVQFKSEKTPVSPGFAPELTALLQFRRGKSAFCGISTALLQLSGRSRCWRRRQMKGEGQQKRKKSPVPTIGQAPV